MQIGSDADDVYRYTPRNRAPLVARTPPIKTTLVAIFLFIGGTFFICFGLSVLFSNVLTHGKDRGAYLIVLGGVMFIPGSYAVTIIYGSWSGWRGYDYSQLPSYDEEIQ